MKIVKSVQKANRLWVCVAFDRNGHEYMAHINYWIKSQPNPIEDRHINPVIWVPLDPKVQYPISHSKFQTPPSPGLTGEDLDNITEQIYSQLNHFNWNSHE